MGLIISLDYELIWGVHDKRTIETYGKTLKNVPMVVSELLKLFKKYEIHATWATVGILLHENKAQFENHLQVDVPKYVNQKLSAFNYYRQHKKEIGENQESDVYHWANDSIREIQAAWHQEIGSHTYSHFYALEKGASISSFESDLSAFNSVAATLNIQPKSIVFPRNQVNIKYLDTCALSGLKCYRGVEGSWLWKPRSGKSISTIVRLLRVLDAYFPISGHNTYGLKFLKEQVGNLLNIPSSAFLRSYSTFLSSFEFFKFLRIKRAMTYAAQKGEFYHLWWHPHNFGNNTSQNLKMLEKILKHYKFLNLTYGFESLSMGEVVDKVNGK